MKNIGVPMQICGSPRKRWGSPSKIWGLQWKFEGLLWNMGIFNENLGVSNENMGSLKKIWGSKWKSGGLHRDVHGGLQWEGVSNSTPILNIFSITQISKFFFLEIEKKFRRKNLEMQRFSLFDGEFYLKG